MIIHSFKSSVQSLCFNAGFPKTLLSDLLAGTTMCEGILAGVLIL